MDFSDFSEFIGPLIFALIAWLSNYFGKKKKQDEKQPIISDNKQKNNDESSIEKLFQSTFKEINEEVESKTSNDLKIEKELIEPETKKFVREGDSKPEISPVEEPEDKKPQIRKKQHKSKVSLSSKLKDKKSLKEAIILKEILERRY
tara:strand:- start:20316 stop:20756 length:441 start_codon:yes stop_codon:yes gene_type:complete